MNVWSITQETYEKQIILRRNGELEYPNIPLLDSELVNYTDIAQLLIVNTLRKMQAGDVLSVCFSKTG